MAAKNNSNELHLTRIYDAPVKTVWDAWTDPKQVAQWWGPRGFTLTTHSKDLKIGGHWDYTMHGPDGTDYPNKTTYLDVKPFEKLVYDHGATSDSPPLFRVTVTFADIGGKTKMDMTMALETPEAAAQTAEFIKKAGGNATWDRLAEYLEKESSGKDDFFINRSFDAPIDIMFEMWTNPEHMAKWTPPTGFTMEFIRADIREGGSSFYKMTGAVTMYGQARYITIQKPGLLVYTQQFTDKDGNLSRHPLAPTWPATMQTTVTFAAEAADKTRVTVHWEVVGDATAIEMNTFIAGKPGMTQGWTGSFDKLEAYLGSNTPATRKQAAG